MPLVLRRLSLVCLLCVTAPLPSRASNDASGGIPPDDALILLKDGNRRFVAGAAIHFQQDAQRRRETATNGQKPFAIILTCSDSRVPPELLFDQGIGNLFVIRVAGNIAQTNEVASIEYGAGHLGTRLVVVLGHSRCGAVTAVVDSARVGANLAQLVKPIAPAVERARRENPDTTGAALLAAAIHANVEQAIADIQRLSPDLAGAIAHGQVRVVGALYDIETGAVQFLEYAHAQAEPSAHVPAAPTPHEAAPDSSDSTVAKPWSPSAPPQAGKLASASSASPSTPPAAPPPPK